MNISWLRFKASSLLPIQARAAFVISPPATMNAMVYQDALANLGVKDLVAKHHQRLLVNLSYIAIAASRYTGRV